MAELHYKATYGSDGKYYADGPGEGNGYYGGTLWPRARFDTKEEAERICLALHNAYLAGIAHQKQAVIKALGLAERR